MCIIKKSIFPTSSAAGNNTNLMLIPNLSFLSCNYTSNYTCVGVFTHVQNAKEAFDKDHSCENGTGNYSRYQWLVASGG